MFGCSFGSFVLIKDKAASSAVRKRKKGIFWLMVLKQFPSFGKQGLLQREYRFVNVSNF